MGSSPVVTVFTPTYNRAGTLHRVYDAVRSQTHRNFEWLVIDDGSTDETGQLVERWQQETEFPIRYFWQENQGKHIAHNHAIVKAQGKFFIIIDSDDSVVPVALERLLSTWESIPLKQRSAFCGAAALCIDQHGRLVGKPLPQPVMDVSSLEMRFVHKRSQEMVNIYLTAVLRDYPFPKVSGVKFIPEGVVWSQIAQKYNIRYINEPLRIYYVENDSTQLSDANPMQLARGHSFWHKFMLNTEIPWFRFAPLHFVKSSIHYIRFSLHDQKRLLAQFSGLHNSLARLLWLLAIPVGVAAYYRDRKIYR